jgi:hypothetical protein
MPNIHQVRRVLLRSPAVVAEAANNLSIDGSAHNAGTGATTTVTLSTTLSNDIIYVVVYSNGGGGSPLSVSGSTLGAFTHRASANNNDLSAYWKLAASPLTNEVITVTPIGAAFDSVTAFAVNGAANTSSPFDANAAIPLTDTTAAADPSTATTTSANTFIIGAFRMSAESSPTAGTGFTAIQLNGDYLLVEYKIVTSAQTGLSVPVGTGVGDSTRSIVDAIAG